MKPTERPPPKKRPAYKCSMCSRTGHTRRTCPDLAPIRSALLAASASASSPSSSQPSSLVPSVQLASKSNSGQLGSVTGMEGATSSSAIAAPGCGASMLGVDDEHLLQDQDDPLGLESESEAVESILFSLRCGEEGVRLGDDDDQCVEDVDENWEGTGEWNDAGNSSPLSNVLSDAAAPSAAAGTPFSTFPCSPSSSPADSDAGAAAAAAEAGSSTFVASSPFLSFSSLSLLSSSSPAAAVAAAVSDVGGSGCGAEASVRTHSAVAALLSSSTRSSSTRSASASSSSSSSSSSGNLAFSSPSAPSAAVSSVSSSSSGSSSGTFSFTFPSFATHLASNHCGAVAPVCGNAPIVLARSSLRSPAATAMPSSAPRGPEAHPSATLDTTNAEAVVVNDIGRNRAPQTNSPWSQATVRQSLPHFLETSCGPNMRLIKGADARTPADFFGLFITPEMISMVVRETNLYREQVLTTPRPSWHRHGLAWPPLGLVNQWKPVTEEEIRHWIGLTIAFGVVVLPNLRDYWSTTGFRRVALLPSVMSRDRYFQIRSCLHLCNNANKPENASKIYKVEEWLRLFRVQCETVYVIGRNAAVDEMIAKCKSTFCGAIKFSRLSKPIREGIKIHAVCSAPTLEVLPGGARLGPTGYCATFDVDLRDGTSTSQRVISMVQRLSGSAGRLLVMDNFYTKPDLFLALLKSRYYCLGTWRTNYGVPRELIERGQTLSKGEWTWLRRGQLTAYCWHDSKPCYFLSSGHHPTAAMVERRQRGQSERVILGAPSVAVEYNKLMFGVDISDMKRSFYSCRQRSRKWWHALLFWSLDVAAINAHITHSAAQGSAIDRLVFIDQLVTELCGLDRRQDMPPRRVRVSAERELWPPLAVGNHFPIRAKEKHCKVCYAHDQTRTRVSVMCESCKVPLCVGKCWAEWHDRASERGSE